MAIDKRLTNRLRRRIRAKNDRPDHIANSMRGLLGLFPLELAEELVEKYPDDRFAQEIIFMHPETTTERALAHLKYLLERYGAEPMSVAITGASARRDLQRHPEARALFRAEGRKNHCVLIHLSESAETMEEALEMIAWLAEVDLRHAQRLLFHRCREGIPENRAHLAILLASGSERFRLDVWREWVQREQGAQSAETEPASAPLTPGRSR